MEKCHRTNEYWFGTFALTTIYSHYRPHTTRKNSRNMKSVSRGNLPYFEGNFKLWTQGQQDLPFLQIFISFANQIKSNCFMRETAVNRISLFLEFFGIFYVAWHLLLFFVCFIFVVIHCLVVFVHFEKLSKSNKCVTKCIVIKIKIVN